MNALWAAGVLDCSAHHHEIFARSSTHIIIGAIAATIKTPIFIYTIYLLIHTTIVSAVTFFPPT